MAGRSGGREDRGARIRSKPDIYRLENGQVIVEDEFLNFLVIKMKTMSQNEIVNLAVSHFSSEWIENAKKVLGEQCKSAKRMPAHQGPKKDERNVESCIRLLNEMGENIPRFVSHHLDELPPITFNSIDVSCMLGKIERLTAQVENMHRVMAGLYTVVEKHCVGSHLIQPTGPLETAAENSEPATVTQNHPRSSGEDAQPCLPVPKPSPADGCTGRPTTTASGSACGPTAESTEREWATVVKKGSKKNGNVVKKKNASPPPQQRRLDKQRKPSPVIVGTNTGGGIQAITTRKVSVFASRFPPGLEPNELTTYLSDKLTGVTCVKIETEQKRYSSFKVTAICNKVEEMYREDIWPMGAFVRRYFEPRKPRDVNTTTGTATGLPLSNGDGK